MTDRFHRRRRRGSNALEMALTMPVFILMMTGIFEFGWMFFQRTNMIAAVRSSCRAAGVLDPDEAADAAEAMMIDAMAGYWVDCGTGSGGTDCTVDAKLDGTSPRETLECVATLHEYKALTGLVPVPTAGLTVRSITRLELQR